MAAAAAKQVGYGPNAPVEVRRLFWRGGTTLALGIGFWVMNQKIAPANGFALFVALGSVGVLLLIAGYLSLRANQRGRFEVRDKMLDAIPWRGDEKVLDASCGHGLLAVGAARRVKQGRVVAVDTWDEAGGETAIANAKADGVANKLTVENADVLRLPYPAASYDAVVSGFVLNRLADDRERERALDEMLRVLKPGGHLALFDTAHTTAAMKTLAARGTAPVASSGLMLDWCAPAQWFVVRKAN